MADLTSEDVVSIGDYFKDLPDPRCAVNRKHLLRDLIVICICAVIAGADGPKAIGVCVSVRIVVNLGNLSRRIPTPLVG